METIAILDRLEYEETLKKIYDIYPKLTADSRTAIMVKTIGKFGPCNWKTIQRESFKDKYQNKLTAEEWQKLHGNGYGIDTFYKVIKYFTKSHLDPKDARKVLYELNDFGKAFCYCFDNLYVKAKQKQCDEFIALLAKYGKTIDDIDSFSETGRDDIADIAYFRYKANNFIYQLASGEKIKKRYMNFYMKQYKNTIKDPEHFQIEYDDDALMITYFNLPHMIRWTLQFK